MGQFDTDLLVGHELYSGIFDILLNRIQKLGKIIIFKILVLNILIINIKL